MSTPKKHHYVPKGILKNFTADTAQERINYIDKFSGELHSSSTQKVARQHYLYRYSEGGQCLEKSYFGKIDSAGPIVIDKIVSDAPLEKLTLEEQKDLRRFVSAQMLRVPAILKQLENFDDDISNAFDGEHSIIKETAHIDFLNSILKGVDIYDDLLSKKSMTVLVQRDASQYFVIGDAPVITKNYGPNATSQIGHSLPIIDWDFISLPLSPKHILIYFNQSDQVDIRQLAQENNDWQFIKADKFVFSASEQLLLAELKIYHQNAYRFIEKTKPEYIAEHSLKYGDKIEIGAPRIAFTETAKKQLRDLLIKSSKNKKP